MNNLMVKHAALINFGDNPLVGLILLIVLVGIAVWAALWVLDNFLKPFMNDLFYRGAHVLIIAVGVIIVVDEALKVIFGISLFG